MEFAPIGWWDGLRLILMGVALFFVPGWLIQSLTLRRADLSDLARIPISFAFSVSSIALLGIACYALKLRLDVLQISVVVLIGLLVAIWTWQARHARVYMCKPGRRTSGASLPVTLIVLFALLCAALAYFSGAWLSDRSDGFYHLATIRRQIDTGSVLSQGVFYANQPERLDPTTGTWHLVLTVFSIWSGIDITWLWVHLPVMMAPLLILAFYAFANQLLKRPWMALFCTVLQYVLYDKLDFRNAMFSNQAGYVLLWVAFVLTLSYLENGGKIQLALVMGLALVMVSWHLLLPELFFVALGGYLVVRWITLLLSHQNLLDLESRRLLSILLPVLAVGVPFLAFRVLKAHILDTSQWNSLVSNQITFRGTLRLGYGLSIINPARLYIVDPRWRFAPYRFVFWMLAYFATPFLIPAGLKRQRSALFLFAVMAVAPVILINPLVISVLQAKIPDNAIIRLVLLPPYGIALGWLFWEFGRHWWRWIGGLPPVADWARSGAWRPALGLIAAGAAATLGAYLLARQGADNLYDVFSPSSTHVYSIAVSQNSLLASDQGPYRFLFQNASPGAVVATDPESGYYLGGMTGRSVIAVLMGHYPPVGVPSHWARRDDSLRILDADYPMDKTVKLLDSYQVCYIWLDEHMKPAEKPLDATATRRKLEARSDLFKLVYDDSNTTIYTYSGGPAGCTR
jgi:hypothetical protein